ncbi:amino acid-binding protein [Clostridia bacterium]|nr:amino acid-binding protein [Clostridia bacterium]
MIVKQVSVFLENKPGRLAEITGIIAEAGVNIRSLSIADTTNFGILRLIVEDPVKVDTALKKNGMTVSITSVLAVCVEDKPGGLAEIIAVLDSANVNVEYMYAFVSSDTSSKAYVVMRIEEDAKAQEVLSKAGYKGPEDSEQ